MTGFLWQETQVQSRVSSSEICRGIAYSLSDFRRDSLANHHSTIAHLLRHLGRAIATTKQHIFLPLVFKLVHEATDLRDPAFNGLQNTDAFYS
jgi:hypothetical protein